MLDSPLSEATIRRGWTPRLIGTEIVCLETISSTMDWLRAAANAAEGIVVFAEEQTAGRGQVGRVWTAPRGRCLLSSTFFRPRLPADRLFLLTMLGACAAAHAVEDVTGLAVSLKWPNDLMSARGKLAGILLEGSIVNGQVEHAILGIGLNVNLTAPDLAGLPEADSLQLSLGQPVNRNRLARALIQALDERYARVRDGNAEAVVAEWRRRLSTIGTQVDLRTATGTEGPLDALGVTEAGGLILGRPDGSRLTVVAGDVSVRPHAA